MRRAIRAICDHGILKLLEPAELPEQGEVMIIIVDDDIPSEVIAHVAMSGGSFDFLADPAEDIYTLEDGEPV